MLEKAEALARLAHADQKDKSGRPYIEHLERVAAAVRGDEVAEAVAWLHDVMEDQPHFEDAVRTVFPFEVSWRVSLLTRWPGMVAEGYYRSIAEDPIALKVKLADIADNCDEARLALLDEATAGRLRRKYAKARAALV